MDCDRLRASLYAYLDGELDIKDTIEAEQHITECPMCEALVRYEERFRTTVRGMLVREPAPAELRKRIAASLDAHQQSRFAWLSRLPLSNLRLAAAASVAAVVVLAVISFLPFGSSPPAAEATVIMDDAVSVYFKYVDDRLPIEYRCREPAELVVWLRGKVPFAPESPTIDAELLGGRIHHLKGFSAACFFYRCPKSADKQFSVFELDAACVKWPEHGTQRFGNWEYVSRETRGLTAVIWIDNGVAYLTVGNTNSERLLARLFLVRPEISPASSRREDTSFEYVNSIGTGD